MNRRNFIRTSGLSLASVLVAKSLSASGRKTEKYIINFPDEITALADGEIIHLKKSANNNWNYKNVSVNLLKSSDALIISVHAPKTKLSEISLLWKTPQKNGTVVLNDQWERTYGNVSWHKPYSAEILPWYFIEHNGDKSNGFGVKTGPGAFCYWQLSENSLCLTLDTRTGGNGVELGDRKLLAAEIVTLKSNNGESTFMTARRFAKIMCEKARIPSQPVYGINDWYFTYGNTSESLIMKHTELMTPMADGLNNRPFSVIDAGWFEVSPSSPGDSSWGDDMKTPNRKFGDMGNLAQKIKKAGMRPGLWTRPLCGSSKDPSSITLPLIKGRETACRVLDPTIPENILRIKEYFKLYNEWGFELVKFDYTSFDLFGRWGFDMIKDRSLTDGNWNMYDKSKTNAEIILDLYKAIREAAGNTYIISCNTFSHLAAGVFELNRVGDDTSGTEWARTKKMGVNTLAFRSIQHNLFYSADGDCVGLTTKVPWGKNKQWMELVAKSGTPLFISAQAEAIGNDQKTAIKECFRLASQPLPVGEPLDWMENAFPKKWKLNGTITNFDWD